MKFVNNFVIKIDDKRTFKFKNSTKSCGEVVKKEKVKCV